MRIAVFGTGGVGGYFGGRLAKSGQNVWFIARGGHLKAIRGRGLRVDSILGDFIVAPAKATDDPNEIGEVDCVLLGVKAWQVREAARAVRPLIGRETCVLPMQNGVEAPEIIAAELGAEHALGGLCGVISFVAGPGHIRHTAETEPFVTFGELDNSRTERTSALLRAFQSAGVKAEVARDIRVALWHKLMLIASLSSIGAITRTPIGVWRSVPQTRALYSAVLQEVFAVAKASGVAVEEEHAKTVERWPERLDAQATTSLQRDMAAGRPSELEEQIGVVVRIGRSFATQTPILEFIYHSLLPAERLARTTHASMTA